MSVFRRVAVVAASMLAAASIAVGGPGAASATSTARATSTAPASPTEENETYLCVNGTNLDVCAYARGSEAISMVRQGTPSITNWFWPAAPQDGYVSITQAGNGLCMQLDHAGGNIIIEATCDGASFQLWEQLNSSGYPVRFRSAWDPSLCLQYDNAAGNILVAGTCVDTWYQQFWNF